jgi:hypothetical protein
MKAVLGTPKFPQGMYVNQKGTTVFIYTVTGTKEELDQLVDIQRNSGIPHEIIMDGTSVTWRSPVTKDKVTGKLRGGYYGSNTIELKFTANKQRVYVDTSHITRMNLTANLFDGAMGQAVSQSLASQFVSISNTPSSAPVQAKTAVEELDMEDFNG